METRKYLRMEQYDFLMPAISHSSGGFTNRRMTSSEGIDHLQDLLFQCGLNETDALRYTTHSLKRTILHWASCSKLFSYEERQCLGHHVGTKKSMLAYSVEEMTRLQGKVYRMLYLIREGLFDPNLSGAARIHQDNLDIMGQIEDDGRHPMEKDVLPEMCKPDCVRHTLSGIIHVSSIDYKLLCGRPHSHNYVECNMVGKSLEHESVCKQCSDVALRDQ